MAAEVVSELEAGTQRKLAGAAFVTAVTVTAAVCASLHDALLGCTPPTTATAAAAVTTPAPTVSALRRRSGIPLPSSSCRRGEQDAAADREEAQHRGHQ